MKTVAEIEEKIVKVDAAIEAVLLGQEYTFDTGMTKQIVKRADLPGLQKLLEKYESDLSIAKLNESNCRITRGISC